MNSLHVLLDSHRRDFVKFNFPGNEPLEVFYKALDSLHYVNSSVGNTYEDDGQKWLWCSSGKRTLLLLQSDTDLLIWSCMWYLKFSQDRICGPESYVKFILRVFLFYGEGDSW